MEGTNALWARMPRWGHGLALGNLCFFAVMGIAATLEGYADSGRLGTFLLLLIPLVWPFLGSTTQLYPVLYYAAWCLMGAFFVHRFGEVKGMILSFCLIYAIGVAVIFYMLTHISFTIL